MGVTFGYTRARLQGSFHSNQAHDRALTPHLSLLRFQVHMAPSRDRLRRLREQVARQGRSRDTGSEGVVGAGEG